MRGAITAPAGAVPVLACALLVLAQALGAQQSPQSEGAAWRAAFDQDVAFLSALGPRSEGSSAELHAADYVRRRLTAVGLTPHLRSLADTGFTHSLAANVEVTIPGTRPDSLLVAVPLAPPPPDPDAPAAWQRQVEPGADAIAPALALGFARGLAGAPQPPPITVRFLFLGAEHGPAEQGYPLGSRLFLQEFQAGAPVAVLYLDLRGVPSHLVPYTGGAGIESPPWLIDRVVTALHDAGQPLRLARVNTTHLVRLGLTDRSLLAPFHQAGYPALRLAGRYRPFDDAQRDLWLDRMREFLVLLPASFADGVPDTWDRHYLLFHGPGAPLIITEPDYVIAMIVTLTLALSYAFVVSSRLRFFLAPLWRDIWRLPLLAALGFAALGTGTAAVKLLPIARGIPTLWHQSPLLFMTLKLAVALLAATMVRYLTGRRWFPRPRRQPVARFYWAAAIALLLALAGAATAVNIALAAPLLWALLCALFATTSRNRWIQLGWIVPAPLWIVAAAGGLLALPALPFAELVLFGSPAVDLMLAVVVLPFALLARGGVAAFNVSRPTRPVYRRRFALHTCTAALAVLIVAGSVHALTISPYGGGLQPLAARAVIDLDTSRGTLHLSSPAPIGTVAVRFAGEERSVTTRKRELTVPLPPLSGLMTVTERSATLRDRHTVYLDLAPEGQPRELRLTLESDDAFVLLSSNHRFRKLDKGSYRLLVGVTPPNPLAVELTVPRDLRLVLRYELEYDRPPRPVTVEGPDKTVVTSMLVTGSIALSS